jgi:hypothetical protein
VLRNLVIFVHLVRPLVHTSLSHCSDSFDWSHDAVSLLSFYIYDRCVLGELPIPHRHDLSCGHAHLVRRRRHSALLSRCRTSSDSRPTVAVWRYRGQYGHAHAVGFHGSDATSQHWHQNGIGQCGGGALSHCPHASGYRQDNHAYVIAKTNCLVYSFQKCEL